MPCTPVKLPDGTVAIVCGRSRRGPSCKDCRAPATLLCDYPVGAGKTCDRRVCEGHAHEIGPDLHYCRTHWQMSGMDHDAREGAGA